jgi:WD40 repeat protein
VQTIKKAHRASIRSIKQCGRYVATASADKTVRLWLILPNKTLKKNATLMGHSDVVETLESIPQGGDTPPLLASASRDVLIKLWNTSLKCCIRTLVGHRNWVKSLKYLQNTEYLASASADGTVRVWNLTP